MKAIILVGTLKEKGVSNTAVLAEFAASYLEKESIDCEIIRLARLNISRGTYIEATIKDDFPSVYDKIIKSDIVIFATPIWWNSHSSEIQRVIERLDQVYDTIRAGKPSPLDGKLGGILITGDSDGAEHVTGNIANFFCSLGITLSAYCSLGIIWEGHAKNKKPSKTALLKYYEREYGKEAQAMAQSFAKLGRQLK